MDYATVPFDHADRLAFDGSGFETLCCNAYFCRQSDGMRLLGKTFGIGEKTVRGRFKLPAVPFRLLSALLLLLIFFGSATSHGQYLKNPLRDIYVDEGVFPTAIKGSTPAEDLFRSGYKALLIDKSSTLSQTDLTFIKNYLQSNSQQIVGFIFVDNTPLFKTFHQFFADLIVPLEPAKGVPALKETLAQKKQILSFNTQTDNPDNFSFINYVTIGAQFPYNARQLFPARADGWFTILNDSIVRTFDQHSDSLLNHTRLRQFFTTTGKYPNFILTPHPAEIDSFARQLPPTVKVVAVDENNLPMTEVRWRGSEGLTSFGIAHLSSPQIKYNPRTKRYSGILNAIPVKEGYAFIPELFTFNINSYKYFKNFKSKKLSLNNRLLFRLPFNNKQLPQEVEQLDANFSTKQDNAGSHAYFNGSNNSIFFKVLKNPDSLSEFTVSFWLQPEQVQGNHAVLSSTSNFVVKIRQKKLCLTIPQVKDVISTKTTILPGQWQHIAVVFSNSEWIRFYKNGKLTETMFIANFPLKAIDQFAVGNDQWEELYQGGVKKMAFWNRTLSHDEINQVYNGMLEAGEKRFPWYGWAMAIAGLLFLGIFFLRRNRQKSPVSAPASLPEFKSQEVDVTCSVYCFGNFSLYDREGHELFQHLSLKKKVFLFVLLYHTIKNKNISPTVLSEIMWPGHNPQSAKNIRSTYLKNIRDVIPENLVDIRYSAKTWSVHLGNDVFLDLKNCFQLQKAIQDQRRASGPIDEERVKAYLQIVSKGPVLKNLPSEILDVYKSAIGLEVIETLEFIISNEASTIHETLKTEAAVAIHLFDALHEGALAFRIFVSSSRNKTKAASILDAFSREWKLTYGEAYQPSPEIRQLLSLNP
ncbi:LamG domain-containing protein [Niabella insulamsoli]|uniref:LamG domain-containing protein n=1 Tax=Niabella insulamsoli TaxID=3144874 RepID=UPI0031FDFCF5